jgi:hypothetical protein
MKCAASMSIYGIERYRLADPCNTSPLWYHNPNFLLMVADPLGQHPSPSLPIGLEESRQNPPNSRELFVSLSSQQHRLLELARTGDGVIAKRSAAAASSGLEGCLLNNSESEGARIC